MPGALHRHRNVTGDGGIAGADFALLSGELLSKAVRVVSSTVPCCFIKLDQIGAR